MRHSTVLVIKFITCLIAFAIGLDLFFNATFIEILSFSLFVTFATYLVGELVILPQLGRRAAAVVDFFLTYLSVWVFGSILFESYLQVAWGSIISATLITVGEIVVHLLIEERGPATRYFENHHAPVKPHLAFGTEFAEDENVRNSIKNSSNQGKK
ncbi:YndM family protein [Bacillus weihaiensis]|uniref:DUF2512 domain-containing protein n=1 Tax=Bacillus weihaiensis TaxID=1547283 RepID=A0A1L3MTN2_9BACI|nr:YndM family protein [Bacillus weihaiensis]APH05701.1 hypothetical protein A9C19_13615 [Bacillus weihaiensis]